MFPDYETTTRNNFEILRTLSSKDCHATFVTVADYVEAASNGSIYISRFT